VSLARKAVSFLIFTSGSGSEKITKRVRDVFIFRSGTLH